MKTAFRVKTLIKTGGIATALLLAATGAVHAKTVYVNCASTAATPDGSLELPYKTIQAGVTASVSGDIVKVAACTYNESVVINGKAIELVGEDPEKTEISGTAKTLSIQGAFIGGQIVKISGFRITNATTAGISIDSTVSDIRITNNIISFNTNGILLNTSQATVNNNIFVSNSFGINVNDTISSLMSYSNIYTVNSIGIYYYNTDDVVSFYDNFFGNTSKPWSSRYSNVVNISNSYTKTNSPEFISDTNYRLKEGSLCIDAGRPNLSDNDPDGTRNDIGVYGGPGAADFWPKPAGGPVVTSLTVSPASVPQGGTITIKATGKIR